MMAARRSSSLQQDRQGWLEWAGVSKPVDLATLSFEKQGDATAFFKAMLNRYRPGERVNDEDVVLNIAPPAAHRDVCSLS